MMRICDSWGRTVTRMGFGFTGFTGFTVAVVPGSDARALGVSVGRPGNARALLDDSRFIQAGADSRDS